MPLHEPFRIIVRQPCRTLLVLPDQSLERQVNPDGLIALHERRAAFWIAKNQKIGRLKTQIHLCGLRRMIDVSEHSKTFGFHCGFEFCIVSVGPWWL